MSYTPSSKYEDLYNKGLESEKSITEKIDSLYQKISKQTDDRSKKLEYLKDNTKEDVDSFYSNYIGYYALSNEGLNHVTEKEYYKFSRLFFEKYLSIVRYLNEVCS